jgi:DNA repair protein RadC
MERTIKSSELFEIAEVELIYKSKVKASQRPTVSSSKDGYLFFKQMWDDGKIEFVEQFKVLLLNRSNKVLGMLELSTGGITGTVADPRLIFVAALKANACSLLIAHNHPSGSLKPSKEDEELTQKIKCAGQFLNIKLLDHIIITEESYFSFADEGLI